jgi:hypothetical protein
MKNRVIYLICFIWVFFFNCRAQDTLKLYGGYIQINSSRFTQNVNLDIFIYFAPWSIIPDSIHLFGIGSAGKNAYLKLCKDINMQNYQLKYYNSNPDGIEVGAFFKDATTIFIGKNDSVTREFTSFTGKNHDDLLTQTIIFKDDPLVVIEKGKTAIINLTKEFKIWTLRFPKYYISQVGSSFIPKGIKVNNKTGDIFIDGIEMDTGFYTFIMKTEEYANATSYYFFTVSVVDKPRPCFQIPETQKKDTLGIPYLTATKSDTVLSYYISYINPAGLGQYSVNWESPEVHKTKPQLHTVKTNDTTLQIELTIQIDSIGYISSISNDAVFVFGNEKNLFWKETLPETFSINVTTTDSQGSCNNEMTSFYISRDLLRSTGIYEFSNSPKIDIYPNPNSGTFTISFNEKHKQQMEIQVYDFLGNLVSHSSSDDIKVTIILPDVTKGIYFIHIQTAERYYNSKVVIE